MPAHPAHAAATSMTWLSESPVPVASARLFGRVITLADAVTAGVVLAVTLLVSAGLRVAILRYSERSSNAHRATWYTVSRLVTYTVVTIGVLIAITALGVPLSRFAVLAGALGVGLGFGLQTIFSNFVAGLILLFDKSVKVGDFVELESGVTGEVRDIRIRATRIVTNDNIDILVPNAEFIGGQVVNWTHRDISRRLRVPFDVAYGTDKDVVKQAALEAAGSVPFTLALEGVRRPQVWLTEFGESALNFELVVWLGAEATKKPGAVTAAYNWALHTALQHHGIEIPFPQRDVRLRTLFGLDEQRARDALRLAAPAADRDRSGDHAGDHSDAHDSRLSHSSSNEHGSSGEQGNDAIDDVSGASAALPGDEEDRAD